MQLCSPQVILIFVKNPFPQSLMAWNVHQFQAKWLKFQYKSLQSSTQHYYSPCLFDMLTYSQSCWCKSLQTFHSLSVHHSVRIRYVFQQYLTRESNSVFPASHNPIKVTTLPLFLRLLTRNIIDVIITVDTAIITASTSVLISKPFIFYCDSN